MSDDKRIRIIVDGVVNLAERFKKERQGMDKEIHQMRNSLKGLRTDLKKAEIETEGIGAGKTYRRSSTGQISSVTKTRQEIERLDAAIKDFKRKNRGDLLSNQSTSTNKGGFFSSLAQGAKEANAAGKQLSEILSKEQKVIRARKAALDIETRSGQIRLNQLKTEHANKLKNLLQERKVSLQTTLDDDKLKHRLSNLDAKARKSAAITEIRNNTRDAKRAENERAKIVIGELTAEKKRLGSSVENAPIRSAITLQQKAERALRDATNKATEKEAAKSIEKITSEYTKSKVVADSIFEAGQKRQTTEFNRQSTSLQQRLAGASTRLQNIFTRTQTDKRQKIESPDAKAARESIRLARDAENESHRLDSVLQRSGRTIGLWGGDLRRGFQEGKKGIVDFGSAIQKSEPFMTRLGQNVGRAVGSLGSFINLRWFFLTSAIQTVGTLAVQLGAALISVASSAALAGAALGAGLAAAASQALPAVGLLAAAFSRVQIVLKAVQQHQQNKIAAATGAAEVIAERTATEQLTDAQYALKQAYLAVGDAQYNLKQTGLDLIDALTRNKEAVLNLAQTRIDVSRSFVDSYFKERDAAISLREAELGVVDAKRQLIAIEKEQKLNQADINAAKGAVREAEQRLKAAQSENDLAGIANARAQLAVAQQSLGTIAIAARLTNTKVKEAKVAVDRSVLTRDQSKVDNKRAIADAERLRKLGLAGNRALISALKEVRDSQRGINQARHAQILGQRNLNAALHAEYITRRQLRDLQFDIKVGNIGQIPGRQQLAAQLAQLSLPEKALYNSLIKLQGVYKKAFRPITDIIVGSFTTAVSRGTNVLKDPKILAAATGLAKAIGAGIDSISKLTVNPEFKSSLSFFFTQAAKNLPLVSDTIVHLLSAFTRLARVGAPLFHSFLVFIDTLAKRFDKFLGNKKRSDAFFSLANRNLDAWLKLGKAIAGIFLALGKGSNKSGLGLIENFTKFLNHISDWMNKHPKKVQKFFDDSAKSFGKIAHALVPLAKALFNVFTSKAAADYVVFIIQVIIPGLILMFKTINRVGAALLAITKVPVVGHFVKLGIEVLVAEKALNKVFPVTQKLTNIFKLIGKNALLSIPQIKKAFEAFKAFSELSKAEGFVATFAAQFPKLSSAIGGVKTAFKALLFSPPYILLAIAAVATAIYLLDKKFHFIQPAIRAVKRAAEFVFNWIKDNWKFLLGIIGGPFILIFGVIYKFRDKIKGIVLDIVNFFRKHWKDITEIIISILLFPGGTIAVAFFRWHNQILKIAEKVVNGIVGFFKKLPRLIINAIKGLPGQILDLFKSLGSDIKNKIIGGVKGLIGLDNSISPQDAAKKALAGPGLPRDIVKGYLANPHTAAAFKFFSGIDPATLKKLKKAKFKDGGVIHAAGGHSGGNTDTVPAMLTPGEWVLNKTQQSKLAKAFGGNIAAARNYLFGPDPGKQTIGLPGGAVAGAGSFALTPTGNKLNSNYDAYSGPNFTLVPSADSDGNIVWFAEFADKQFGEVSVRDANRMLATNGGFIPKFLQRSAKLHGGLLPGQLKFMKAVGRSGQRLKNQHIGFAMGGVVHGAQHLASGGPVLNSPAGGKRGGNVINQHFNVQTQGETDWNYALRLGAVHAQESY